MTFDPVGVGYRQTVHLLLKILVVVAGYCAPKKMIAEATRSAIARS